MLLILLFVVSLVLYVYFKVVQARVKGPLEKGWYSAKGSIAIGIFFIAFGINAYLTLGTTIAAFVALLFVAFGLANVYFGWKQYRKLLPLARKEVEEQKRSESSES
ncbi:YtpI-like protein [Evansella caseinilytica]|uniref:YtpI-like protein n=1 Tax=Evansella caseinilytica TaxID=1503961 RepID=A0A1H3TZP0_9BACI|nr:YtpI family protein [Evansella caseinilytica]SDZ54729.1 YtpI-like protein [Evansella caseinilytica]